MTTKQQQRRQQQSLKPGQSILPAVAEPPAQPLTLTPNPARPFREVQPPPPAGGHPAHGLRPEQWVLLELSKAAMYTADEAYPSARDAVHQLTHLKELTREILEFRL